MPAKVIKYVCSECFKEFSAIEKEEALLHCRFTHKNPSHCNQVNYDE